MTSDGAGDWGALRRDGAASDMQKSDHPLGASAVVSALHEAGLQAVALFAAAQGAVHAYAHVTGDEWRPHASVAATASTVEGRSTTAMTAALAD